MKKEISAIAERESYTKQSAFYPGRVWRDTEGKRIQAHGGALFYEDGTYYWYGENKDRTDGKSKIWTWGIRAYESKDLYNWKDLGLIILPELSDKNSNLYPEKHLDRPHIFKNSKTGNYVCWIKLSGNDACFVILSAEHFTGPYRIVKENYRPENVKAGDFDIVHTKNGTSYLFMDADHQEIAGYRLTEDGYAAEQKVSRQYFGLKPPFCREGIAVFERRGKKYMLSSGMSGYIPNKSDSAFSDDWEQPFESIGNPHIKDESGSSCNSQISQVFQVPGKKDLYIAVADRWVPEFPVDARIADIMERAIAGSCDPEHYRCTPEEQQLLLSSPLLGSANTSIADYVWLPLQFSGENLEIIWRDRWTLDEFE